MLFTVALALFGLVMYKIGEMCGRDRGNADGCWAALRSVESGDVLLRNGKVVPGGRFESYLADNGIDPRDVRL
jgi:hypothetical protein